MRAAILAAAMLSMCIARSPAAGAGSSSDGKAPADSAETASAASATVEQAIAKQETFRNMELTLSTDPEERFHALGDLAKAAYDAGFCDKAQRYSRELLRLASHNPGDWYYGQAFATGNTVLGRVVLKCDGNVELAADYLRASEATLATPLIKIQGPNMSLAQDLLKAGDRETVIEFIEASRKSWTSNDGRPEAWERTIRAGGIPNFGPNLLY